MTTHAPTLQTLIVITVFAVVYMRYLLLKTLRDHLDLYDLLMLSMIALVPAAFVYFPQFSQAVAELVGVTFPFVVMFGLLLAILFGLVHRLTVRIYDIETRNRLLMQELSLLQFELSTRARSETR
jgi:hypothetical protein